MTNEERDLITRFIQRVGGAPAAGFGGGSVPATAPAPAPVDPAADALIADLFQRYPEARYRMTQTAFVQEHALVEAQNQINRLQWELTNLRQQQQAQPGQNQPGPAASPWGNPAQAAPPPQQPGMFGRMFGGGQQAQPQPQYQQPQYQQPQYAPPQPQYAPGYQPGMFQQRGSGFLGSALTTAAGVAGGLVAGNALMNLFSGNHGGGFGGGGFGGGGFGQQAGYFPSQGGGQLDAPLDGGNSAGSGWQDASSSDGASGGGWQDASSSSDDDGGGGGWQDASGGGSDDINNS